jgi:hypothetical protein
VRSCHDVLDVHHARRDTLRIEPAQQIPPAIVYEEVPDLHRRKSNMAAGVLTRISVGLKGAEIPRMRAAQGEDSSTGRSRPGEPNNYDDVKLGRTLGLVHSMPADETALIARPGQGCEAPLECLEHRVAVEEDPGRVAAHRTLL